jgi:branched-chain amino acid transport system permease protein
MALVAIVVTSRLVKSRQGRAFSAIKEHEPLAKAIGVDPFRHAMLALAVAVATAGAAGAFMAVYVTHVSPELGSFHWTLTMLTMIAIGGQGTIWGPVLGSFIFVFLPEYLRVINEFRMPIYGVILMITVLFFPGGLWPLIQRGVERLSPGVRDRDTQTVDSPEVIDAEYAEAQSLASEEA